MGLPTTRIAFPDNAFDRRVAGADRCRPDGEYDALEQRLFARPVITVPTAHRAATEVPELGTTSEDTVGQLRANAALKCTSPG
jgi:hypothetical protein